MLFSAGGCVMLMDSVTAALEMARPGCLLLAAAPCRREERFTSLCAGQRGVPVDCNLNVKICFSGDVSSGRRERKGVRPAVAGTVLRHRCQACKSHGKYEELQAPGLMKSAFLGCASPGGSELRVTFFCHCWGFQKDFLLVPCWFWGVE